MKTKIFQNIINDCLRRNNIIGDYLADETKLLADAVEKVIDEQKKSILKCIPLANNPEYAKEIGNFAIEELDELKTKLSELKL